MSNYGKYLIKFESSYIVGIKEKLYILENNFDVYVQQTLNIEQHTYILISENLA